jgi:integrase
MSKIEEFLKMYDGKGTYAVYRWAIREFFKTVGTDGDHYFTDSRNYEEDIKNFLHTIKDKPPKTIRLMLSVAKSFLIENEVELPERFWRRMSKKVKGTRALTLDIVPSNDQLRRIISHMPIHGKALFLMLASSGMRIGEALSLDKDDDIDLAQNPVEVRISGKNSKNGDSRINFISSEAKEAVEEWLKTRGEYLTSAVAKCKPRNHYKAEFRGKNPNDNRLFPFEISTANTIWTNAVRKAGMLKKDKQTDRNTLHPHVLRKFFRSKMATLIPVDVTEALMGHEGYLTEVYRRYSQEDLTKFYLQGESTVLVFGTGGNLNELRQDFSKAVKVVSEDLETKNKALEEKVQSLEKQIGEMYEFVHKNLDPMLELFNEIADTAEGKALLKKLHEEKLQQEYEKSRVEDEGGTNTFHSHVFTVRTFSVVLDFTNYQSSQQTRNDSY